MSQTDHFVNNHYSTGIILNSILNALTAMGKDIKQLKPEDLAPVDQFHFRGRLATIELANRADVTPGMQVLDVGCGLGGSARYLATEYGCQVTGIDLTEEYVEVASALAQLIGLDEQVDFQCCSALELPFDDNSFDIVWTEHIQMNIKEKDSFYLEMARVLKTGGHLLFHDIFQGNGSDLYFPVAWAEDKDISFLVTPESVRKTVECCGLQIHDWEDKSLESLIWFEANMKKSKERGRMPLGLHLLMGESTKTKFQNMVRNLREGKLAVVQAVAEKY